MFKISELTQIEVIIGAVRYTCSYNFIQLPLFRIFYILEAQFNFFFFFANIFCIEIAQCGGEKKTES